MRKTTNFVRTIMMTVAVASLLVMTGCQKEETTNKGDITAPYKVEETNPRHTDGVGNIAWLENAKDIDYPKTKKWIKNYVWENTGIEPDKVAISCLYLDGFSSSCYYKVADEWYEFRPSSEDQTVLEKLFLCDCDGALGLVDPIWRHSTDDVVCDTIEDCEALSATTYREYPIIAEKLTQKFPGAEAVGIERFQDTVRICYKYPSAPLWYKEYIPFDDIEALTGLSEEDLMSLGM